MRRFVSSGVALGLLGLGAAACGSSGSTNASSTSTTSGTKAAFCAANVTLDKASSTVNSGAEFLTVLKQHSATLDTLQKNVPAGKIGTEAKALLQAARTAVATNNVNALEAPNLQSDGADIDTYCGVDGSGDPLPSYFGAGKGSNACQIQNQISAGTSNANGPADLLTFLSAHQNLVSQFAAAVPNLPASIKSQAQTLVTTVQQAIATHNADLLGTQAISNDAMNVSLYCGQNQ